MEEFWRVSLVCLLVYGGYLLVGGHLKSIFLALCYNTLSREIKRQPFFVRPFILLLSLSPVLSAVALPSAFAIMMGREVYAYLEEIVEVAKGSRAVEDRTKGVFSLCIGKASEFLKIRREEDLTEALVVEKLWRKAEESTYELFSGSRVALEWVGQVVFFMGLVKYFSRLQKSPLHYLLKPLPKSAEIAWIFDSIVHTLCNGSVFGFISGAVLGMACGSPLVVSSGVASAFLSVFPVAPVFLYSVPSLVLLWCRGNRGAACLFMGCALVQQVVTNRRFIYRFKGGDAKTVSIALGISAFGLPGVVLGPFLLSSLATLWPSEGAEKESANLKASPRSRGTKAVDKAVDRVVDRAVDRKMDRTMDILKKNK